MPSSTFYAMRVFFPLDLKNGARIIRAMTLDQYLAETGIRETPFAELIGTTQPTVNRLRKGQVPSKELMARIYEATGGKVTANDFYGQAA